MYFLMDWNIKYPHCTNRITFDEVCIFLSRKQPMISGTEQLSSDLLKEDIINNTTSVLQIAYHDTVAFCRDKCL
jgi:hypothetical protein